MPFWHTFLSPACESVKLSHFYSCQNVTIFAKTAILQAFANWHRICYILKCVMRAMHSARPIFLSTCFASTSYMKEELKTMALVPLGDRILVKRSEEDEQTTSGGIIIPDTAKEKPQEGEVVAVGNGRLLDSGERQAVDVAIGDLVLFAKYGGTEVTYDGTEYLILREDDILAKVS